MFTVCASIWICEESVVHVNQGTCIGFNEKHIKCAPACTIVVADMVTHNPFEFHHRQHLKLLLQGYQFHGNADMRVFIRATGSINNSMCNRYHTQGRELNPKSPCKSSGSRQTDIKRLDEWYHIHTGAAQSSVFWRAAYIEAHVYL